MNATESPSTGQPAQQPRRPNGTGSIRLRGKIWWIRWYDANGCRHEENSESTKQKAAERLLRLRQGDMARGVPITAQVGRLRFGEAAKDLITEYTINGRRSLDELERRVRLHLEPFFGGRRMAGITTADVRAYIAKRQAETIVAQKARRVKKRGGWLDLLEIRRPVSAAEINRELTALKRMFSLAMQAGKLLHRPHIPMMKEHNVRTGFFEPEQFDAVVSHLPEPIRPVVLFAYYTGWRITSDVLPLQWRQIDRLAGEVRLDPGTTKNDEARTFPYAEVQELRELIEARWAAHRALAAKGRSARTSFSAK